MRLVARGSRTSGSRDPSRTRLAQRCESADERSSPKTQPHPGPSGSELMAGETQAWGRDARAAWRYSARAHHRAAPRPHACRRLSTGDHRGGRPFVEWPVRAMDASDQPLCSERSRPRLTQHCNTTWMPCRTATTHGRPQVRHYADIGPTGNRHLKLRTDPRVLATNDR